MHRRSEASTIPGRLGLAPRSLRRGVGPQRWASGRDDLSSTSVVRVFRACILGMPSVCGPAQRRIGTLWQRECVDLATCCPAQLESLLGRIARCAYG